MSTRRALVAAGAGALLAGCGRREPGPEREADVLSRVLAVELALVRAYGAVPGRTGREHGARASDQVAALEGQIAVAGGAPAPRPPAVPAGEPVAAALALEQRAVAACLDAIGRVGRGERRSLLAQVLSAAAANAAILADGLGRDPLASAFADGRSA